jgi:hypothetical protein
METELVAAETYAQIRLIQADADVLRQLFRQVDQVRQKAEATIIACNLRIGEELKAAPVAKGGEQHHVIPTGTAKVPVPTLAEQVGSKNHGLRLKKLATAGKAKVTATVQKLHEAGKEATVTAVLKAIHGDDKKERLKMTVRLPSFHGLARPRARPGAAERIAASLLRCRSRAVTSVRGRPRRHVAPRSRDRYRKALLAAPEAQRSASAAGRTLPAGTMADTRASEVLAIERKLDLAERYMTESGLYTADQIRQVNELRMRARWRLGILLAQVERGGAGPGRGKKVYLKGTSFRRFIGDLGLHKNAVTAAQRIGALPETEFDKALAEAQKKDFLASFAF